MNATDSTDSQNGLFASATSPIIDDAKAILVVSNKSGGLQLSDNKDVSPRKCYSIKRFQEVQMVTSTPLLRKSVSNNAIFDKRSAQEEDLNNMLFKNHESGVKAPCFRKFVPQRIQLTPCAPDATSKNCVSGSLLTEKETSFYGNRNSGNNDGEVENCMKSTSPNADRDVSSKSSLMAASQAVAPKVLTFQMSPLNITGQRNCNSIDMFDDLSISYQNKIAPKFKMHACNMNGSAEVNVTSHDNETKYNEPATHVEQNLNRLNSFIEETKPPVDFKEPLVMIPLPLIPIKKGGKNWRRSIIAFPSKEAPNVINKRNTITLKALPRKSTIVIEPKKRSTLHMADYGTTVPEIAEISVMAELEAENEYETEKIVNTICSPLEYDASVPEKATSPGQTSYIAAKSASYIVPGDGQNDSMLGEPDIDILAKVLSKCTDNKIIAFGDLYDDEVLSNTRKIGEGSYGEVFLLNYTRTAPSVLKIVPVDGRREVNDQPQTKLSDMLAEIVVSTELNRLKGYKSKLGNEYSAPSFITLRKCTLVEGSYPTKLLEKWDDFNELKGSENCRPDDNLFLDELSEWEQRFVALEYENGGKDLENVGIKNALQGLSIFLQIAHAIAGNKTLQKNVKKYNI